jgi:hypothetical protein
MGFISFCLEIDFWKGSLIKVFGDYPDCRMNGKGEVKFAPT